MKSYVYHSPLGDRQLTAKERPQAGFVDLYGDSGELEIGKCPINSREGGCTPSDAVIIDIDQSGDNGGEIEEGELSKEEIKEKLDALGVEYDARLGIAKLKELLDAQQ